VVRVDIFLWRLDVRSNACVLAPSERMRSESFLTAELRGRYIAGRARLRKVLGKRLGLPPAALPLVEGPHGKSRIGHVGASVQVPSFNLSHSADIAVLAVTDGIEVGVDVETLRSVETEITRQFFSEREQRSVTAWPDARAGFFALWTAKEAVMKGLGLGLHMPLDSFEVSARPDEEPYLTYLHPDVDSADAWRLRRLDIGSGYLATIAVRCGLASVDIRIERLPSNPSKDFGPTSDVSSTFARH